MTRHKRHHVGEELPIAIDAFMYQNTLYMAFVHGHMERDQDVSLLEVLNRSIRSRTDTFPRIRWDQNTSQAVAMVPVISAMDVEHYIIKRQ